MKVTLKHTIGVLKFDGKEYGPGDKVEMSKEDAGKIAHHLEEGMEIFGEEAVKGKGKGKGKDLDDAELLK